MASAVPPHATRMGIMPRDVTRDWRPSQVLNFMAFPIAGVTFFTQFPLLVLNLERVFKLARLLLNRELHINRLRELMDTLRVFAHEVPHPY